MLRSTRELGLGVRVGVTGFGPYEVTIECGCDLRRAAESSSRSVQYPPECDTLGEWPVGGECVSIERSECSDRTSS